MTSGIVNLDDYMDSYYGAGAWTGRTGIGTGSDIGPALINALNAIRSSTGRGKVIFAPRTYLMNTAPTADQYSGIQLEGCGSQASKVVWNSNTGCPFSYSGNGGYTGGGIKGIGLLLEDGYPSSMANGITLQGNATYQPDQMEFSDIYMSAIGSSYWYNGFFAYGNARTSPQGIRVCNIANLQVFKCRNTGIYISNAVQWTVSNVGVYVGSASGNNFYLGGGGTPLTNSVQAYIYGLACSGDLNLTNCTKFNISGSTNTVSCATSADYGDVSVVRGGALNGSFGPNTRLNWT